MVNVCRHIFAGRRSFEPAMRRFTKFTGFAFGRKPFPNIIPGYFEPGTKFVHLLRIQEKGVILRMADGWEHPAFLRISENHRRAGTRLGLGEGIAQFRKIMTAKI